MKKFLAIFCLLATGLVNLAASEPVGMSVGGDESPAYPGSQKAPVLIPTASIDGHTFSISGYHADYTLVLVDENDAVVYTTFFPTTLTEVELPSTLSGDYELRLYPGGSCKFPFTPYF